MASAGRYSRRSLAAQVLIATGVVVGMAVSPAESQFKSRFNPQFRVSASYTDNAFLSSEGSEEFDTHSRLGLVLPYSHEFEHGSLGLSYALSLDRWQDFDELDNLNHHLNFSFSTETSLTSAFSLGLGYTLDEDPFGTQDSEHIDIDGGPDDPLFIVGRRVATQRGSVKLGFDQQVSTRWSVDLFAGYSASISDELESDETLDDIEDRDDIGGGVGLWRDLSEHTSLGLNYAIHGFDLQTTGQSLSHSLGVGWRRDVNERLSFSFQIGGFYRDRVVENVIADDMSDMSIEKSDVGIYGSFEVDRTLERYGLSFTASHHPSAGDVLVGTSTDTIVSASLSPLYTGDRWSWTLSARYGHRVPDLATQNPLDSFDVDGSVRRSLGRRVGLSLSSSLLAQNEHGANELDIVTSRTSLTLSFRPFARSSGGRIVSAP